MPSRTLFLLVVLNLTWAGTYAATKYLMADAPFFLVTSLRYLVAVAALVPIATLRAGLAMPAGDLARCVAMGIATFTLSPAFLYAGVARSRASDAAILVSMEPLMIALGAALFLRERLDRRTGLALLVAFAGALLISEFWTSGGGRHPVGTLLILAGVVCEAAYSVVGKGLLARHDPLKVVSVALGAASLVNAAILSGLGVWSTAAGLTGTDWAILVVYLAGVCTAVGYTYWFVALEGQATGGVALTIFLQPAAGIAIAALWVGERPTAAQLCGAALILASVAAATWRREKANGAGAPAPAPPPAIPSV